MSWAGLANNQIVSFNNLQDAVTNGYFTALATIPVSNEEITKTDASTYVNCDPTYYLFAAKTSNQLIAKRDLVTTTTTTTSAPCECFTLTNNDSIDISVSYYDCTGGLTCAVCNVTSTIYLCVQAGQGYNFTVSYGTGCGGGATPNFTWTQLFTNCTTSGDCSSPAPLLRTFRVLNSDTSNSITLDVQVNSTQVITPTLIPANTAVTLTPQVNCLGYTNVTLEYQLVSGYTPSSASFSNGSGTYTGTIAGGFITFTNVNLQPNTNQDLTVNP